MKNFQNLCLVILIPLFFACENESSSELTLKPPSETYEHKIPVETALAELESMLRTIDQTKTRSGGTRRVASVKTLRASDFMLGTRSGYGEASDIGDMVYVANFENESGYAILGADDRIESVIAITEHGSLTPAQLIAAAAGEYNNADSPPVVPEIGDYLRSQFGGIHMYDSIANPNPSQITRGPWYTVEQKGPYCKMKWGQSSPYNMKTQKKDGQNCVVGCVAVALGQIVATNYYNKYYPYNTAPEPTTLGGQPIIWREIFSAINRYSKFPDSQRYYDTGTDNFEVRCVAYFLSGIGQAIGMDYGISSSSATRHDAARFLKAMGFRDVDIYYFSEGKLKEMVVDRGLPTYIRGHGLSGGHAWVVDGIKIWDREVSYYYPKNGTTSTTIETRQLYHCNFGWNGRCDGYYYAGSIFNPRGKPLESEIGDTSSTSAGDNLTSETRIIYYNLF